MNRIFISLLIVIVAVAGLLLFQASKDGTSVVMRPSVLAASPADAVLNRIRVVGRVASLPIDYQVEPEIKLTFSIHDPGPAEGVTIPLVYRSLKPDMFAPGRDVIIDGEFQGGILTAQKLLTQCPSKYEPPLPVAPRASGDKSYQEKR